jgi:hypothetical protein
MTKQEQINEVKELEQELYYVERELEMFDRLLRTQTGKYTLALHRGRKLIDFVHKAYAKKKKILEIKIETRSKYINDEPITIDFKL